MLLVQMKTIMFKLIEVKYKNGQNGKCIRYVFLPWDESLPNRPLSLKFDIMKFDFVNYWKFFSWASKLLASNFELAFIINFNA